MSRIGRAPVALPGNVTLQVSDTDMQVKGPKGSLACAIPDGVVIVDHKTFPVANHGVLRARAAELRPQLDAYAEALRSCGRRVLACCLHFPIAGAWVELLP